MLPSESTMNHMRQKTAAAPLSVDSNVKAHYTFGHNTISDITAGGKTPRCDIAD